MIWHTIDHADLRRLAFAVFAASGSDPGEAKIVSDHLVEANLTGHDSHGVGLIPTYMQDLRESFLHVNGHAELVSDADAIGIFDGGMAYGHVVAREATEWGVARAGQKGVAIVALRNAYHIARVGSYGEQAVTGGLVAMMFVNVFAGRQIVAPFGGSDGRLHTNPMCIAIPTDPDGEPVILDFATSQIAMGKLRVAYNEQRRVGSDILIDAKGAPTEDPGVLFEEPFGALRCFGGYKGFGLAAVCEILGGALTGGPINTSLNPQRQSLINGMLAVFIDPARFGESGEFAEKVKAIRRHLKGSPPTGHDTPVLVAGEPERISRAKRLVQGVPIDDISWNQILAAAEEVGVNVDDFRP